MRLQMLHLGPERHDRRRDRRASRRRCSRRSSGSARLLFELRPAALDRDGLVAALRRYVEHTAIRPGLDRRGDDELDRRAAARHARDRVPDRAGGDRERAQARAGDAPADQSSRRRPTVAIRRDPRRRASGSTPRRCRRARAGPSRADDDGRTRGARRRLGAGCRARPAPGTHGRDAGSRSDVEPRRTRRSRQVATDGITTPTSPASAQRARATAARSPGRSSGSVTGPPTAAPSRRASPWSSRRRARRSIGPRRVVGQRGAALLALLVASPR